MSGFACNPDESAVASAHSCYSMHGDECDVCGRSLEPTPPYVTVGGNPDESAGEREKGAPASGREWFDAILGAVDSHEATDENYREGWHAAISAVRVRMRDA